jgi:hypothetical protein
MCSLGMRFSRGLYTRTTTKLMRIEDHVHAESLMGRAKGWARWAAAHPEIRPKNWVPRQPNSSTRNQNWTSRRMASGSGGSVYRFWVLREPTLGLLPPSASQQRALVPPLFALAAATPFLCSRAAARLYRPDCRHDLRARGSGDWDWRPQLHGSGPRPLGTPAPAPSAATGSGGRGGRGSHLSPDQVSTVPLWEKIDWLKFCKVLCCSSSISQFSMQLYCCVA